MTDAEICELINTASGWLYEEEAIWLHRQAESRHLIVELGVWQGRSTLALASATPGVVHAVDHWLGSPEELDEAHAALREPYGREMVRQGAERNLAPWIKGGQCKILWMSSESASKRFEPKSIGMLFVDAGHDEESVASDLDAFRDLVAPDGLWCGHDYTWEGVARAVDRMFGWRVKRGPGSIWFVEQK